MILIFIIAFFAQNKLSNGQEIYTRAEVADNALVKQALVLGACMTNCVVDNIAGRCWSIFDCIWPCFSDSAPPTNPRPSNPLSRPSLLRMARPFGHYANFRASQDTTVEININAYVRLFDCFGKCLKSHLPTDPLTLVGLIGCALAQCVCGGQSTKPRSGDRNTVKGFFERYNKYWNQKSYQELGKFIDGSIEWQSNYGYDAGLSYR